MLVLNRKPKESITMHIPPSKEGTTIEIVVKSIQKSQTKIGFIAPVEVDIRRDNIKKGKTNM